MAKKDLITAAVEPAYRKKLIHRYDDNGYLTYFTSDDFPGLGKEDLSFMSGDNRLHAYRYYRDGSGRDAMVIFCHGIGGGHRSYMAEINEICLRGWQVFTYDCTGCFSSEGEDIKSMCQSLADLDAAVRWLKAEGIWQKFSKHFVVGHSWGGYAAGNIANYHSDIDKAVVISGFVSIKQLYTGYFGGGKNFFQRFMAERFLRIEQGLCPEYADSSSLAAADSGKTAYFFAHSEDDPTVNYSANTGYIKANTKNRDAQYFICSGKGHNPNYTLDAVEYMHKVLGGLAKEAREKKLKTAEEKRAWLEGTDWHRMTAQDPEFWDKAAAFLSE